MDNLKTLMERQEYDLVLSLTRQSSDSEALFYRISALLGKNQGQQALDVLLASRDSLFAQNPMLCLKSDFELRFMLKQFDEAYQDVAYFREKPYVSQAVEEYIRDLPTIIRTNERNAIMAHDYSDDDIERILESSSDDYEVLSLLNYLRGRPIGTYVRFLKDILVSQRHPHVKTFALLLMIAAGVQEKVVFSKNGKVYSLIPSTLKPPYQGEPYDSFVRNLAGLANDPSVSSIATSILSDYILDIYPESAITRADDHLLMVAIIKIARQYLRSSIGIQGYLDKYGLDEKAVEELAKHISEIVNATPGLKM